MKFKKLSEQKWYNGAVIVCIGVVLYVVLTHLGTVLSALGTFIGFFKPVIFGMVIAYIMSPLANSINFRLLHRLGMRPGQFRWCLSVIFAVALTLVAFVLLIGMLIPQLVQSISFFAENIDDYAVSLLELLEGSPVELFLGRESMETIASNAMTSITVFVKDNASGILGVAASSGKNILIFAIAFILAIYLLIDKRRVLVGARRFLSLMLAESSYEALLDFLLRCDTILVNYIVQTLIDAFIVGGVNAVFMAICGMPYIGLISVVVGVTNLIPNFGPIIGGVIGAFILLLVDPVQAVMFIVFTLCLQLVDGYVLKPKLFSSSLGVSGLLILTSTIVLGNMFGIVGILLSIPAAAVCSFIYSDYFVPWKKARNKAQLRLKNMAEQKENAGAGKDGNAGEGNGTE